MLLTFTLTTLMLYPIATPALAIITLLLSLAFFTYAILEKHKGIENAHAKILKEAGVMILTRDTLLSNL